MYIKLSSKKEADPANFKNRFLDQLVIKPNSCVSLVSASLARDGLTLLDITYDVDTPIYFKFSPYDYRTYTVPSWNIYS